MLCFVPAVALALTATLPFLTTDSITKDGAVQMAAVCFKTGERTSGMNKICYYDCMGSEAAITIGAVELCPLSINN